MEGDGSDGGECEVCEGSHEWLTFDLVFVRTVPTPFTGLL